MCVRCSIIPNNERKQSNHTNHLNIVRDNSCNIILNKDNNANDTSIKKNNNLVISNTILNIQNNTNKIPGTFTSEDSSYSTIGPKIAVDKLSVHTTVQIQKIITYLIILRRFCLV